MASETTVKTLCMDTGPFDPEIGDRLADGPPWGSQNEIGAFRRCVVGGSVFRRAGTPPFRDSDKGCDRYAAICTAAPPAV